MRPPVTCARPASTCPTSACSIGAQGRTPGHEVCLGTWCTADTSARVRDSTPDALKGRSVRAGRRRPLVHGLAVQNLPEAGAPGSAPAARGEDRHQQLHAVDVKEVPPRARGRGQSDLLVRVRRGGRRSGSSTRSTARTAARTSPLAVSFSDGDGAASPPPTGGWTAAKLKLPSAKPLRLDRRLHVMISGKGTVMEAAGAAPALQLLQPFAAHVQPHVPGRFPAGTSWPRHRRRLHQPPGRA